MSRYQTFNKDQPANLPTPVQAAPNNIKGIYGNSNSE